MNKFQRNIYRTVFENEIPIISCSETTSSGGIGVTEYTLMLDKPLGGIVIMDFDPQGVPDKLEIIHNGVKKATSGMTVANSGPFDNIYGEPTIPDTTQAIATDQFIGTIKGAVPNRDSIFLSETGITDIVRTKQQLIWWVYTQPDYELLNNVIVRVTGIDGTAWTLQRLCTDQTPTGGDPPFCYCDNCVGTETCYSMLLDGYTDITNIGVGYRENGGSVDIRVSLSGIIVMDKLDGTFTYFVCSTIQPYMYRIDTGEQIVWTGSFELTTCL